jgi:hypothetical protein
VEDQSLVLLDKSPQESVVKPVKKARATKKSVKGGNVAEDKNEVVVIDLVTKIIEEGAGVLNEQKGQETAPSVNQDACVIISPDKAYRTEVTTTSNKNLRPGSPAPSEASTVTRELELPLAISPLSIDDGTLNPRIHLEDVDIITTIGPQTSSTTITTMTQAVSCDAGTSTMTWFSEAPVSNTLCAFPDQFF